MPDIMTLSLTGPDSHRLVDEPGRGDVVVGPVDGTHRPDLVVTPDQAINWHVFDGMQTGGGSNWPRYIRYEGADTSLFAWMRERETEEVDFTARGDLAIDVSDARLDGLTLRPRTHTITITLPRVLKRLSIIGDPRRVVFTVAPGAAWPRVSLDMPKGQSLTSLAGTDHLAGVRSLSVGHAVLGSPFDCRSLLPLRDLRSVSLYGAMAHLDALAALPLEGLQLRFIPDLGGLPDLSTWPGMRYFVAWNVDESVGKTLRQAVKRLPSSEGDVARVSQLRSRQWFIEEHGLPFGGWASKNEKAASKAFKAASKRLKAAGGHADAKGEAKAAIVAFVEVINAMPGIETSERDDAGEAVAMLAAVNPGLIEPDEAMGWFNETRDF